MGTINSMIIFSFLSSCIRCQVKEERNSINDKQRMFVTRIACFFTADPIVEGILNSQFINIWLWAIHEIRIEMSATSPKIDK